jgi:hypothetical protein
MPIRLLFIAVLLCAAQAIAQSHTAETSKVAVASTIADHNAAEDLSRISPYPDPDPDLQIDGDTQKAPSNDSVKAHRKSRNELIQLFDAAQNRSYVVRGMALQSDVTCYAIRSYLVVRDDPKSDATHRDGSTTCVPAARVRMFTTADQPR